MGQESSESIDEIIIREKREAVNFIPRKEYKKLGLTTTQRRRLNLFVNNNLLPHEIAKREHVGEDSILRSLNMAINIILNSDGYSEKEQRNWEKLRNSGL
ncbi:MAG TPA: hypothetical protein PK045_03060 [Candidatus Woesebacteria bacterium]|nr:hypothetical protein [Candidatus Woesebacteria bacterium]